MAKGKECIGEVPIDGRSSIEVSLDDQAEVSLQWPTDLSDKEVATKLVEAVSELPEAAAWETEIIWGSDDGFRVDSIDEYLQEERFNSDGLVFRLNCGPFDDGGFSVVMLREAGESSLQGSFSLEGGDLANAVIEATIVPEGSGKTTEIAALALAYS